MSRGGDFWSRRKAAVRAEEEAEARAREEEARAREAAEAAEAQAALEEKSDAEVLEELGLKDPDEMQPGDDFSAFLKAAVPERLRRRALRKLWGSNPVLACLDGLNDYDDDYTAAATNFDVRTAYKVGEGLFRRATEPAAESASGTSVPEETPEPEATQSAEAEDPADAPVSATVHDMRESNSGNSREADRYAQFNILSDNEKSDAEPEADEPENPPHAPRRMRFRFD